MEAESVHSTQVAMVVSDDFVRFKIPTLDHFILTTGEEIWMSRGDSKATNSANVSCQRQLQLTGGQVPDLDSPVGSSTSKPLVVWLNC